MPSLIQEMDWYRVYMSLFLGSMMTKTLVVSGSLVKSQIYQIPIDTVATPRGDTHTGTLARVLADMILTMCKLLAIFMIISPYMQWNLQIYTSYHIYTKNAILVHTSPPWQRNTRAH